MHRIEGHRRAWVLMLCAIFSLIVCGVVARAAGVGNTLTVDLVGDEEYRKDLATADVVVDVYKLATATYDDRYDTYNYELVSDFSSLESDFIAAQEGSGGWADLAENAAAIAKDLTTKGQPVKTAQPIDQPIAGLDDAIYLVLARGADQERGSSMVYTKTWGYTFQAGLIALPNKGPNDEGTIRTDNPGPWLTEATINLKSERQPLYGSLTIYKEVTEASGAEQATFVFHIKEVGKDDGYENYAAITYPVQTSNTITHIPAGITVTVTEVYFGGRYKEFPVDGFGSGSQAYIHSDQEIAADKTKEVASVYFKNEPSDDHPGGGHGIENRFTFDGDWPVTATPADKRIEE